MNTNYLLCAGAALLLAGWSNAVLACDGEKPPLAIAAHHGNGAQDWEMNAVRHDQQAADEALQNFSPICVDRAFATRCEAETKPDCASLSPQDLQAAPYVENHRRYKIAAVQRPIWKKAYERLYKKWSAR